MKQTDVCKTDGIMDEVDNNIPLTSKRLRRSLKYIGYTSLDNQNAIILPQNIQDEHYCINNLDYSDEGEEIVDLSEEYGVPLNVAANVLRLIIGYAINVYIRKRAKCEMCLSLMIKAPTVVKKESKDEKKIKEAQTEDLIRESKYLPNGID
uniref:Uncharacterized protein n=1 Tax=Glossina pallidipes TaxID=7398 RepID=A0A1B0A5H8_GLOPL